MASAMIARSSPLKLRLFRFARSRKAFMSSGESPETPMYANFLDLFGMWVAIC
jgi:hypothetical protein